MEEAEKEISYASGGGCCQKQRPKRKLILEDRLELVVLGIVRDVVIGEDRDLIEPGVLQIRFLD